MANTNPVVDSTAVLSDILTRAKKEKIHLYSCANVTQGMKGKETVDFDALADAGAAGFTDDGVPVMDESVLEKALLAAKRLDLPVSLHEEDKTLISQNGINGGGKAAQSLDLAGSPREAEITLIQRDLELAVRTGAPLCIQHISTAEGVDLVRRARKLNPRIHAEATPHHFSLTEDAVLRCGTFAKVNPPLRTEADRMAIIEGLADGTIDLIATGKNIIRLRKAHGLTVRQLQLYFGFEEPQAIYKWQQGKSLPSVDNLYALSRLLGVSMNEILVQTPQLNLTNNGQSADCPFPFVLFKDAESTRRSDRQAITKSYRISVLRQ
jgi:transcriptional regulator with XRE-family HTH domain